MSEQLPRRARRLGGWKGKLIAVCLPLVLLVALEAVLRLLTEAPKGQFSVWFPGAKGLYPEGAEIEMTWGAIPYTMRINSLGLRGPEPALRDGTTLIAAMGDSFTDGFYVDDADTYPVWLEAVLRKDHGLDVAVINAARAGGSIDKQFTILRQIVLPLRPKVVILQFCTNDIAELAGKSRDEWLAQEILPRFRLRRELGRLLLTRTALGELAYDAWLRATTQQYRKARTLLKDGADRYDIAGGTDFAANVKRYNERFAATDGLVLQDPFTTETQALVDGYLFVLERFHAECAANGAALVMIYEPAYPQVYDERVSMKMRDLLAARCAALNIPFVDLTAAMRSEGAQKALHLAPVDFHLNPDGNRLTASCVATALVERVLRPGSKAGEGTSR